MEQADSGCAVEGDAVARARRRAADEVSVRAAEEVHPLTPVAEVGRARRVRADVVALHGVLTSDGGCYSYAFRGAARDDVARGGGRPADRVVACAVNPDADADSRIGDSGARRVGAYEVSRDDVARRLDEYGGEREAVEAVDDESAHGAAADAR